MNRYCGKPYADARTAAGLTQEQSSSQLSGVSVRSLQEYEAGRVRVPDDVVVQMIEIYRAPRLKEIHCSGQCALGAIFSDALADADCYHPHTAALVADKEVEEAHRSIMDRISDFIRKPRNVIKSSIRTVLLQCVDAEKALKRFIIAQCQRYDINIHELYREHAEYEATHGFFGYDREKEKAPAYHLAETRGTYKI
ncbi:helix-turn-helix domain-containing protein [Heliobacillus mobilis]|uniref:Helix-turn-helix domain-containing protein n=1 Tax=Heliobacterium mobile TaxID=28064 RepID=A0A6I3SBP5_HELMO|nr:helix-turn-helix domain-containing protein [Heliobacterium mobile]MTV47732.1 helix-turn-helix domain-containing protein [Heliobacterium mobile]